jgi:hypothetical protein
LVLIQVGHSSLIEPFRAVKGKEMSLSVSQVSLGDQEEEMRGVGGFIE